MASNGPWSRRSLGSASLVRWSRAAQSPAAWACSTPSHTVASFLALERAQASLSLLGLSFFAFSRMVLPWAVGGTLSSEDMVQGVYRWSNPLYHHNGIFMSPACDETFHPIQSMALTGGISMELLLRKLELHSPRTPFLRSRCVAAYAAGVAAVEGAQNREQRLPGRRRQAPPGGRSAQLPRSPLRAPPDLQDRAATPYRTATWRPGTAACAAAPAPSARSPSCSPP
eukprot:scaffold4412_cov401-Prasinococcus_capsulatus_cf.AAC.5